MPTQPAGYPLEFKPKLALPALRAALSLLPSSKSSGRLKRKFRLKTSARRDANPDFLCLVPL